MGEKIQALRERIGEVRDLAAASAVLGWDQQVNMPPGGTEGRAYALTTLSKLTHQKSVSDDMGKAIEDAKAEAAGLDPDSDDARLVQKAERDYLKDHKVPNDWVGEFTHVTALGYQVWEKARAASDFSQFQPALEKIISLRRQYADFFAPYDHVYDALLDDFEPGMKTAEVKAVFDELRTEQVALVQATADSRVEIDDALIHQPLDEKAQWNFGVEVIKAIGYDFNRGRQDKSVHPFTTGFNPGDVRITTRIDPEFLNPALFGSIHECGHAMYEQGINPAYARTPLDGGASLGFHESQSRMWENMVGRSRPFWTVFYSRLQHHFPVQFGSVDMETFFQAINKVEPSLIRVEADEATYNLHIMLRFELELALMDGSLAVQDLPAAWNKKSEQLLGITPPNDRLGVLQDVHWSGGMVGYFPTYALGNLIAAQLWEKILADIPDLEDRISAGKFSDLLDWLRTNVHTHGAKYKPMELLKRITGQTLTAAPYLRYLKSKFGDVYSLS
ncbi:MAG: carboxypeptidase M32 [Anaerolineales bacterium]|nr:carboxypeptidase M32 [Anaerolineales bacterium]